jgi:hypothetical protein
MDISYFTRTCGYESIGAISLKFHIHLVLDNRCFDLSIHEVRNYDTYDMDYDYRIVCSNDFDCMGTVFCEQLFGSKERMEHQLY